MSTSLPAPVRTLLDAANSGDIEGFLNGFTPDGVVDDWGRELRGRSRIRSWSDAEFIGQELYERVVGRALDRRCSDADAKHPIDHAIDAVSRRSRRETDGKADVDRTQDLRVATR